MEKRQPKVFERRGLELYACQGVNGQDERVNTMSVGGARTETHGVFGGGARGVSKNGIQVCAGRAVRRNLLTAVEVVVVATC